jgi:hypothetical protein
MVGLLPERRSERPKLLLGHRPVEHNQVLAEASLTRARSFSLCLSKPVTTARKCLSADEAFDEVAIATEEGAEGRASFVDGNDAAGLIERGKGRRLFAGKSLREYLGQRYGQWRGSSWGRMHFA